jgi:hypothetical protein
MTRFAVMFRGRSLAGRSSPITSPFSPTWAGRAFCQTDCRFRIRQAIDGACVGSFGRLPRCPSRSPATSLLLTIGVSSDGRRPVAFPVSGTKRANSTASGPSRSRSLRDVASQLEKLPRNLRTAAWVSYPSSCSRFELGSMFTARTTALRCRRSFGSQSGFVTGAAESA